MPRALVIWTRPHHLSTAESDHRLLADLLRALRLRPTVGVARLSGPRP